MFRKTVLLVAMLLSVSAVAGCSSGAAEPGTTVQGNAGGPVAQQQNVESQPVNAAAQTSSAAQTGGAQEASEAAVSGYPYTIVDTNQKDCYSDTGVMTCPGASETFFGQDAQYAGNTPSYVDNGDGTVTDLNTGLTWTQSYYGKMTWSEAVASADGFSHAGYDDWRLPTIKELYSLMDFNGSSSLLIPYLDTDYFEFVWGDETGERVIDAQYWSSTAYVGSTTFGGGSLAFGVNFADGRIKGYPTGAGFEKTAYVRYVRGNTSYGINDFVSTGSGTVIDQATGLEWMQNDSGSTMNWGEALAYCEALSYGGYDDWRLPDTKELQSIVDYSRAPNATDSAAIDPIFNVTEIQSWYWTSTTLLEGQGDQGLYIAFGQAWGIYDGQQVDVHGAGAQRGDPKSGDPTAYVNGRGPQNDEIRIDNYVRCVRGGASFTTATGGGPDIGDATGDGQQPPDGDIGGGQPSGGSDVPQPPGGGGGQQPPGGNPPPGGGG